MKLQLAFFLLLLSTTVFPCTSFFINTDDDKVVGKNFDWITGIGQLIKNNEGMDKTSLVQEHETPVHWTSKYGSITFNQFGLVFTIWQSIENTKQ